jgi:hypothetical protein
LFFARHLDNFIMTRNCSSTYRDLVSSRQFIVTRNFRRSTGTGKKTRHRDLSLPLRAGSDGN